MKRIADGLYTFTGLMMGRVYLIEDADGLTLVDAGIPSAANKIVKQLSSADHDVTEIKRILITHAHPDHVGALPALLRQCDAELIMAETEYPILEGEQAIPRAPVEQLSGIARRLRPTETTLMGLKAGRVVADGDRLDDVMGGLQIIATPGHSPGHLSFWHPDTRILFCGDVILNFYRLRLPFSFFTVDMAENIRSIKKVVDLIPQTVCFGHGPPLQKDTSGKLRNFAQSVGAI